MASDPMQLFGLYLDMKRRREQSAQAQQQMEVQRQQMEMQSKAQRQQRLMQVLDLAKVDPQTAIAGLHTFMPDYTPDEEKFVKGIAKSVSDQRKAAEESAVAEKQYEQVGPELQQGIAQTLAPLMAARAQGKFASPEEQGRFGQSLVSASQGLGESPFLRGLIASGVSQGSGLAAEQGREFQDFKQRGQFSTVQAIAQSNAIAARDYEWWKNPDSGEVEAVNAADRKKKSLLQSMGYGPVPFSVAAQDTESLKGPAGKANAAAQDLSRSLARGSALLKQVKSNRGQLVGLGAAAARESGKLIGSVSEDMQRSWVKKWTGLEPEQQQSFVTQAKQFSAQAIQTFTGETSGRFTDTERRITDQATIIADQINSPASAIGALDAVQTLGVVAQYGQSVRAGNTVFDPDTPEGYKKLKETYTKRWNMSEASAEAAIEEITNLRDDLKEMGVQIYDKQYVGPASGNR